MTTYVLQQRYKILINTDPQMRCYNGAHFSTEYQWSSWEDLESDIPSPEKELRRKWWKDLNDYAVSQRGESARKEFRIVPAITQ